MKDDQFEQICKLLGWLEWIAIWSFFSMLANCFGGIK